MGVVGAGRGARAVHLDRAHIGMTGRLLDDGGRYREPMDDALRRELLARFEADQRALSSLYEAADTFRDEFDRSQTSSDTPWPFAILEWEPADQAPALVIDALSQVRINTRFLRELVARVGWPGRDLVGEDGADAAWLLSLIHI